MNMSEGILSRAGKKENFSSDKMQVIINPSDICNFKCSYCINQKARTNRVLPRRLLVDFIEDLGARGHDEYYVQITGGEPLIYPHRLDAVRAMDKYVTAQNKTLLFVTNGSLLAKNGLELFESARSTKIRFWLSMHLEQMDAASYLKTILDFPYPDALFVSMLFPANPGQLPLFKYLVEKLSAAGIAHTCTALVGDNMETIPYSPEEMDFLASLPYNQKELLFHEYLLENGRRQVKSCTNMDKKFKHSLFNYQGYHCAAGRNTLRLDPGANLVRCFGLLRKGIKYNLNKTRLRDLPDLARPCVCPVNYCCQCDLFLDTPKWRDAGSAPAYIGQNETIMASAV